MQTIPRLADHAEIALKVADPLWDFASGPRPHALVQDFSEVVQQCSLGSPELSIKALMAYPDVKIMASFVYRCLREAVPFHSRV
jgi:hypothetical protein